MRKILNNFIIIFAIISLCSCHDSKEINKSITFIDCGYISNNMGNVYGLIIKHDSIYSCVKTNTVDKSFYTYSALEKASNDFNSFVDNLTLLADKYDQSENENVVDGSNYVLIIKNDNIEKKYHFNSILMTDSLFEKIKMFKDYSEYLDFKPVNKFAFPTNEMCIETELEPNPFE